MYVFISLKSEINIIRISTDFFSLLITITRLIFVIKINENIQKKTKFRFDHQAKDFIQQQQQKKKEFVEKYLLI